MEAVNFPDDTHIDLAVEDMLFALDEITGFHALKCSDELR